MIKQKSEIRSNNFEQINQKELERIEKIWKINISELPDDVLVDIEDFPEIIKKTKASLGIILKGIKTDGNDAKINDEDFTESVLKIIRYAILEVQMSQVKSGEGCKNMYI